MPLLTKQIRNPAYYKCLSTSIRVRGLQKTCSLHLHGQRVPVIGFDEPENFGTAGCDDLLPRCYRPEEHARFGAVNQSISPIIPLGFRPCTLLERVGGNI